MPKTPGKCQKPALQQAQRAPWHKTAYFVASSEKNAQLEDRHRERVGARLAGGRHLDVALVLEDVVLVVAGGEAHPGFERHEGAVVGRGPDDQVREVVEGQLNALLAEIREGGHTRSERGRRLKINYATQTGSRPPVYTFWCNAPDLVDDNFERFLENRLRQRFDLTGTPVRLKFRRSTEGGDR